MTGETAFAPDSLVSGALLPAAGRDLMVKRRLLPPGAVDATADGWLTPEIPILVRDRVRILPMAWWGASDHHHNPNAEPGDIDDFARHLLDTGMYAAGPWTRMDLGASRTDSIGSYVAALRASGATKADSFVYVLEDVGVAVVWAGDKDAGDRSLAVHVVPKSWVFERGGGKSVDGIDVSWSWADVVGLRTADSL